MIHSVINSNSFGENFPLIVRNFLSVNAKEKSSQIKKKEKKNDFQSYFQRVLSIRNVSYARTLSLASMFGCLALAVPSAMIGMIARATEWSSIESYNKTILLDKGNVVLPLVLRYLTPQWVSFAGKYLSPSLVDTVACLDDPFVIQIARLMNALAISPPSFALRSAPSTF